MIQTKGADKLWLGNIRVKRMAIQMLLSVLTQVTCSLVLFYRRSVLRL